MRRYALPFLAFLGFYFVALTQGIPVTPAVAAAAQAAAAQEPAIRPGTARVWFLRAQDSPGGNVRAAAPTVFANSAPVGDLPVNSEFFRDVAPGTYRFTVEADGLPTAQATTIQLAAGTAAYLQVQWAASWQQGYPEANFGFAPNTFIITTPPPQVAQAYLPTLAYLGPR
jgi:hypothetical protein